MLRCEYKDPDSPAPHLNCCDSFGSDPEAFQSSCVNRLGGKIHNDGACKVWDLPWLPETSPGRWRGTCALAPTHPEKLLAGIEDDPSSKLGKETYTAPDVLHLEKNGHSIQASLYDGFGPEAAFVENDPRRTQHSDHDLKVLHTLQQNGLSTTSGKASRRTNIDGKHQAVSLFL